MPLYCSPWIDSGIATVIDWPKIPASPAAEEDCIRRALGRFRWVGFMDADEFLVIRERAHHWRNFWIDFRMRQGVGLQWRMFGSSMQRTRPAEPVILAYQKRAARPSVHIKTFVRPERAAQCRNAHSWFYYPLSAAVGEQGKPLYGSINLRPTAEIAWINHYYCKSEEDYLEKAARRQTQDLRGNPIPYPPS